MSYSQKVELYKRIRAEQIRIYSWDHLQFDKVISDLKECAQLRNQVVHANWHHTDAEGYTHIKFKISKDGLEHQLVQFTTESLNSILTKIDLTRTVLCFTEDEIKSRLLKE